MKRGDVRRMQYGSTLWWTVALAVAMGSVVGFATYTFFLWGL